MRGVILAGALALASAAPALAQTAPTSATQSAAPQPRAEDVASPEAIVGALYAVISGDKGQARDWRRFRSLFHPSARLTASGKARDGRTVVRPMTPEEYISRNEAFLVGEGFHEQEIARRTERFGSLVHVWTTYEARRSLTDASPFMRGINSVQLLNDGQRWWVMSVYWLAESPDQPLPPEYLP